jgi:flagellar hook-associated protein 2
VASSSSSVTSGTLGNAAPVSFPGISSGIDYNAIIQKFTATTLAQNKPTQNQINNLSAQNIAILKVQGLIGSVQDSLTALSDPGVFGAFKAIVANAANGSPAATTSQIKGQQPIAGTYVVNAQTVATATSILNDPAANGSLNLAVPADQSGTSIAITNGAGSNGKFTVNGVQINYDASTQTIPSIIASINTALSASGGSATLNANGTVTLTGVTSLGSGGDSGNLEQVLKLDTAQLVGGTVTSASTIAGINQSSVLNQNNNAGFATPVTSGTFTINGVSFTVDATKDSLSNVISRINGSTAGVTATYNSQTSQITLQSKTAGPQAILLGAGADTSNLLAATGLTTAGRTQTTGTQASLTYTDTLGPHTVYSSTNDFTTAIPGIDININTSSPASLPAGSTFYTVTVAADPSKAEAAIGTFVKAYNAAIQELNKDTVAPTVKAGADASNGISSATSSGGGVLYGNFQISGLRDQLVNLVSGFIPSGSSSYNSLASVGLKLDTSSQAVGTQSADADSSTTAKDSTSSSNNSFTVNATSGQLAALDVTAFEAAYAANTSAVQNLFTLNPRLQAASGSGGGTVPVPGATYGFSYLLGQQLAQVDGLSTFLTGSLVSPGNLATSLLNSITTSNNQQIDSLQQQITLINNEATQQADSLRAQFTASETQIARLQALQAQISKIGN